MKICTLLAELVRHSIASIERTKHGSERGQVLIEYVMATGFLVAIAIVINKLFAPVVLDAFEKISKALSSVGP
jgi:hypothetical protein